jgi:Ras-related protein Rab-2A
VGKSCLLARIMDNDFKIEHQVTIGVEFGAFVSQIEDKVVKLQIWDTAGQESFRSITRIFYRGAHCVFLTYDITREETFNNVGEWLKEVKQHANPDILIYLLGNFCDLEEEREISRERALEFCRANGIDKFFETSAKTGDYVEEVFSLAARELYVQ